jgi:hypothetical protein
MKVWRGFGILVLFLVAGAVFGGQLVTDKVFGDGYWQQNAWPAAAGLGAAAVLCWFVGRRMNKPARKSEGDHRRTWTHDLLFVRMEWWAFPLAGLAVAAVALNFTPGNAVSSAKAAAPALTKTK